jgi:hypothetical protein
MFKHYAQVASYPPNSALSDNQSKVEYEITHNLIKTGDDDNDVRNLHRLLTHPMITNHASLEYVERLRGIKPYYKPSPVHPAANMTRPVTWYMDDENLVLRERDVNWRLRLTPGLDSYVESAVKGKAQAFNGPGGLARHEDELKSSMAITDPHAFTDPVSQELVRPVLDKTQYFYHASDVTRHIIGVPFEINGRTGIAEIAFDDITYIKQTGDAHTPLKSFYRLCQFEVEYANPESDGHKHIAEAMGLSHFSKEEIAQGLHYAVDLVLSAAKNLGIDLIPSDDSKGCIGFKQLALDQGLPKATPPLRTFPSYTP